MAIDFAVTGRGVRALDTSQVPVWSLSDVEPIVEEYSWKIVHTEETPAELTPAGTGIVIPLHYWFHYVFTQRVVKRFNMGDSDVLSSGQMTANPLLPPSSFPITQSYFRPDISQLAVFPLPTNIPETDFVHKSRTWLLDKMAITFDKDRKLYELRAELTARTVQKEKLIWANKFTLTSWSALPIYPAAGTGYP